MDSYAGKILDSLNFLCKELGSVTEKHWIKEEGPNSWYVKIDSYARSHEEILDYDVDGLNDNKWHLRAIIRTWELYFTDGFFAETDHSLTEIRSALDSLLATRNKLAHNFSFGSRGEAIEALEQMILIAKAFRLDASVMEMLLSTLKELTTVEKRDIEKTELNRANAYEDKLTLERDALRAKLKVEESFSAELQEEIFNLKRRIREGPVDSSYIKSIKAPLLEEISDLELENRVLLGRLAILKLTTANSDTPIQQLTELQELIEELEDCKRKLDETEIERRKAVDHARLYRSEKRIAEDTLDQKNVENIRLRKNLDRETQSALLYRDRLKEVLDKNKQLKNIEAELSAENESLRSQQGPERESSH